MTDEEFEQLVSEGIDAIPERFISRLENVAIVIADEPTQAQLVENDIAEDSTLFGLYEGIPLPVRGDSYGGMIIPDKITIFKKPIIAEARDDKEKLRALVFSTVWHEVAHYFGYDDEMIAKREDMGTNFSI
ncbi:MAG: hypothetical protein A2494_00990 [Candidatus Lloydbacteria bacterium RIFOXYC12_FULL_46_25]|uniref:Metallopeptidase family protein n=1 Tax=Candidatus Lloydbacteria bacterium RIFOXYC12_FULL_46_25 TaxID=1798670 RepID=A0A1G2DWJ2_9BACT|nr:MAG: hypothetical protein A2494_00990 [Candidatus Lloydbacteria bacterium RIFOXYC12_FULL_46_25]